MTTGKCDYDIMMKRCYGVLKILIKYTAQKSARIWSYSGPHLPACGLNMERYEMSEYNHFSRSDHSKSLKITQK